MKELSVIFLLLFGTASVSVLGQTDLKPCPGIVCTRQFIPDTCRATQVLNVNGTDCFGCPRWKKSCIKSEEPSDSTGTTRPPCPETVCTLEFIPSECKEIPQTLINGVKCDGCPRWKAGCQEKALSTINAGDSRRLPRIACPILNCGLPIPRECRVEKTYTTRGQVCTLCPDWQPGCREEERLVFIQTPRGAIPSMCPEYPCPEKVPKECQESRPYNFRGRNCFRCPTWRSGCKMGDVLLNTAETQSTPSLPCPILDCKRQPGIDDNCYEPQFFTDANGRRCELCPTIKPACKESQKPRPTSHPCPLLACPLIYIPDECRDVPVIEINGQMCKQCPRHRTGCVPSQEGDRSLFNDMVIPGNRPALPCPLLECSAINIPDECKEVPVLKINGKLCKQCPKHRQGCVPSQGGDKSLSNDAIVPDNIPALPCPLLDCTTAVDIPDECKEVPEIALNGQMCKQCPRHRAGCVPSQGGDKSLFNDAIVPGNRPSLPCPLLACPAIYIPEECIEVPELAINGQMCKQCPRYKVGCIPKNDKTKSLFNDAIVPGNNPTLPCPLLACPAIYIPDECKEVPVLEVNGQMCKQCPRRKAECVPSKGGDKSLFNDAIVPGSRPSLPCPLLDCPKDVGIPDECREVPEIALNGQMCKQCPRHRQGCVPTQGAVISGSRPSLPCPLLACPMIYIPEECSETPEVMINGQMCKQCPTHRIGCIPGKNDGTSLFNDIVIPGEIPRLPCPLLACPAVHIPVECREIPEVSINGKMCKQCPRHIDGCVPNQDNRNSLLNDIVVPDEKPTLPCPLLSCPKVYIPDECKEIPTVPMNGRLCRQCPIHRQGCVASEDAFKTPLNDIIIPGGRPVLPCPLLACPAIHIPAECMEVPEMEISGQICKQCPRHRPGCIPTQGMVKIPTGAMTPVSNDCPPKPCTRILIPPECREEKTYVVNGKTCKDCPRWREGCVPGRGSNGGTGIDITCPLVACPRIFIPPACRLEQPYQFQGKTCFKCPMWKPSCRSGTTRPDLQQNELVKNTITGISDIPRTACPMVKCARINAPKECIMQTTFEHNGQTCPGCPTQKPGCPETVSVTPTCPVLPCPMIHIPEECKEQRPFNYRGTTCFGCPRHKPGCVATEEPRLQPSDFVTKSTVTEAPKDPNSLVNLAQGPIPIGQLMSQVDQLTCPPLPCPDMLIPDECREQTTYNYQGRVCRGCPRWRFGCQPHSGGPMNFNANGILSFSLFNELFVRK